MLFKLLENNSQPKTVDYQSYATSMTLMIIIVVIVAIAALSFFFLFWHYKFTITPNFKKLQKLNDFLNSVEPPKEKTSQSEQEILDKYSALSLKDKETVNQLINSLTNNLDKE